MLWEHEIAGSSPASPTSPALERRWDELRTALAGRVLVEGHCGDFKAALAAGDKANQSVAVDSGVVVVGVDEATDPATPTRSRWRG